MLKNIRNNWTTEKTQTLEFRDPDSGEVVHAKWAHLKQTYNEEVNHSVKRTNLDYRSIYPNNFEKQKVSLALNVFNEKTAAVLKQKKLDDTALFISKITRMWHILNAKSPNEGVHLNDPDRHPISSSDDERLLFENMATSLKLMDNSKRG